MEGDLVDAEAVDGAAQVRALIVAPELLDGQRVARNAVPAPVLGHPFAVLSIFVAKHRAV